MFGSFCDFRKCVFVYSKTSGGLINEVMRNPGRGNTVLGSDTTVITKKCAYVYDFATGPGGVQTHSGEKVSEKCLLTPSQMTGDNTALCFMSCFSNFVRPRPGKLFFHKARARSQQIYS